MTSENNFRRPLSGFLVLAAFAAIYLIWGTTFLAVRFAVESIPPFTMAGARFFLPGLLVCVYAFRCGEVRPNAAEWRTAAITGGCLLLLGSGSVAFAARYVPSGVVALLAATMPLFVTVLGWLARLSPRPTAPGWAALALGLLGVYCLIRPSAHGVEWTPHYRLGIVLSLFSPLMWAIGSLYFKRFNTVVSPLLAVGMQLLCGGLLLLVLAGLSGEFRNMEASSITFRSVAALLYLATCGSLVAFTAYSFLLKIYDPALVATYAFVNPVVAVLAGALLGGESISASTATGALVIVAAVIITIVANSGKTFTFRLRQA